MDVFYPWPYNRGDNDSEMSNQIFAQQALGGFGGNRNAGPHAMPVPSGQPWNVQEMPWGTASPQPHLMQFTAQTSSGCLMQQGTQNLHCKRKPVDLGPPVPAKQFISEEKMAEHLSGLHISSTYTTHQPEQSMDMMEQSLPISEQLKGKTLVLCDELKNLKAEPIIPTSLLDRIEKPCMSLVLWKPKESILEKLEDKDEKSKKGNQVETTKRSGVLVVPESNSNIMDVEM